MIQNNLPDFPNELESLGIKQMEREYNEEQKQLLEDKLGMTLAEIYNDNNHARDLVGLFTCEGCGDFLPLYVIKRYNFDIHEARCPECQKAL